MKNNNSFKSNDLLEKVMGNHDHRGLFIINFKFCKLIWILLDKSFKMSYRSWYVLKSWLSYSISNCLNWFLFDCFFNFINWIFSRKTFFVIQMSYNCIPKIIIKRIQVWWIRWPSLFWNKLVKIVDTQIFRAISNRWGCSKLLENKFCISFSQNKILF